MISIMALVLVISIGFPLPNAAAQSDKYSKMAPVDQYLMERNAEILLAQSAAPDSDVWCCSLTFAGVHWAFVQVSSAKFKNRAG
jgi:hypothetical protein